jgi:spermidine synthase
MVEIDEAVVRASKAHLPTLSIAFGDPKLDLQIADGIEFVKKAPADTYDLVIVDGSDPVGPAEGLFTAAFFKDCHRVLKSDGVLVTQGESPLFHEKAFAELNACLKGIFKKVHTQLFHAPTYPTGMWSLQLATKNGGALSATPAGADSFAKEHRLKYYNGAIHSASFALPGFVRTMLKEE